MRATRRYALTLGAILGCLLLPLGGCGGNGSPSAGSAAVHDQVGFSAAELAAAGASPGTGSPAPVAPAPTKPAAAHDATSAEGTLRYFWEAYTYAYRTYDTRPLESVSEPACTVCTEVRADVGSIEAAETHVQGYGVSVRRVSAGGAATGPRIEVVATISRQPGEAVDPRGRSTELPGFAARRCTATLSWNGTAWVITKIVTEEA